MPAVLVHGTVIDLADQKIKTINRQVHGAKVEGVLHRFLSSVLCRLFTKITNEMSSKFTDDAIWFRGAAQTLWNENIDVRYISGDLIPRLDRIKNSILMIHAKALADLPKISNQPLRKAQSRWITSAAELFESIEEFKWTLKELEANYGYANVRLVARSQEELKRAFDEVQWR